MYRHTQLGRVTLGSLAAAALLTAALAARADTADAAAALAGVLALLILIGVLFGTLTIEVRGQELRSHFGPGIWRRRVPLSEIEAVALARSHWWEGWGIRVTPRGMLYNVSGTQSVEIRLRSGRRFRLGTDEPERLAAAIRAAIAQQPV